MDENAPKYGAAQAAGSGNVSPRSYTGQTVLILGAARSGVAAAEFLLSQGARVILSDVKNEAALGPALRRLREAALLGGELILELGGHEPESFRRCDLVVISPGVPAALPFLEESRRRGIPVMAEMELASRHLKGTIVGITGSNGKTTTTTLATEILIAAGSRAYAAGNIGMPLISYVEQSEPGDIYVTEVSSFQLECIFDFRPRVAALLNLSPDHLDRYPGFEEYANAKRRIFMNQTAGDLAVLNADDERVSSLAAGMGAACLFFSRRSEPAWGTFIRGERAVYRNPHEELWLFDLAEVRVKGVHNLENALAACAVTLPVGATGQAIRSVIRSFQGVEHRLEWVAEIDGVGYFNDSKATNVDAAVKSLEAFPGGVLWIAGGRDKGGDFTRLRELVRRKAVHAVLIGEAAGKIADAVSGLVEVSRAQTLPEAVSLCRRLARPGQVVLLAPACASFDMFQNYEERGRVFKQAVGGLQGSE
jgi:UDP-N-acetylmuramoylalanine--D-glutamate ligase